jgi:hypothetical protein
MTPKAKIEAFFSSDNDSFSQITKYEENKLFFNNLLVNGSIEDVQFVLKIKIMNYVSSLNDIKEYKKALIIIEEIERDFEKVKSRQTFYKTYLPLAILLKGVALHRVRKYSQSNVEFKRLLLIEPKKEKYLKWYRSNRKNKIAVPLMILTSIALTFHVLVRLGSLSYPFFDNVIIQYVGLIVGIISFIISFVWRRIIDKSHPDFLITSS